MIEGRLAQSRDRLGEMVAAEDSLLAEPRPDADKLSLVQSTSRITRGHDLIRG